MNERQLYTLGQIGGYASGFMAYFNVLKDVIGFIGVIAGAALSIWALWDRFVKWRKDKKQPAP